MKAAASLRARLTALLEEEGIVSAFPAAVLAEVETILADPRIEEGTADWTALPFVTIDNDDSRDLDQALLVQRDGDGFVLRYALADAAFYVRPGMALFEEALARGSSYYLPDRSVPMLPPELSEGLISLNPSVPRRSLAFTLSLDARGEVRGVALEHVRIISQAKLSYSGVQSYYDAPEGHALAGQPYTPSLDLLRVVGELRMGLADERGVIDYNRRELSIEIACDAEGVEQLRTGQRERHVVERYNEQLSLAVNAEGAQLLLAKRTSVDAQLIFRIHPSPLPERLEELRETISGLVDYHHLADERWRWLGPKQPLAAYLARLPREPRRLRQAIERQLLYVNRASTFEALAAPHHALKVGAYARFSSPMREIAGIFTHKEALEALGLLAPSPPEEDLLLRDRAIEAANQAKRRQTLLERKVEALAIDETFAADLDLPLEERPARQATIFGVRSSRLYVELDVFPMELKVYSWDLEETYGTRYELAGDRAALCPSDGNGAPTFAVGEGISLRPLAYDQRRTRWRFALQHL